MEMYPNLTPQMQAYNQAYANPYLNQMRPTVNPYSVHNVQQPYTGLNGRIVDDFNSLTANDVPMDNFGAVFIKRDGAKIEHRRWTPEGKILTTCYKPILDSNNESMVSIPDERKQSSSEASEDTRDQLMQSMNDLSNKVDTLIELYNRPRNRNNRRHSSREGEENE
jgi:hypothetical protein